MSFRALEDWRVTFREFLCVLALITDSALLLYTLKTFFFQLTSKLMDVIPVTCTCPHARECKYVISQSRGSNSRRAFGRVDMVKTSCCSSN